MFLILMVVGLVGLVVMAIPAFAHGHALSGHTAAHGAAHGALQNHLRFLPSPRAVFSVLALYGAFGNAGVQAFHLTFLVAALAAAVPALFLEWALVRPLWRLLFRFQGSECSPLEQLTLTEAEAVVPFRNGRGIVSTVRDGRRVQLSACLRSDQIALPIRVGDGLLIEDVDAARERVTVSVFHD